MTKDRPELSKLLLESKLQAYKVLEDAEIIDALDSASRIKQSIINRQKYEEELRKPISKPIYNAEELKKRFLNLYNERFDKPFELDDYSIPVLEQCIYYFTDDERFQGDLNKGLFITGNPGCGKTSLMKILARINTKQPFALKSCKDISNGYSDNGFPALEKYKNFLPIAKAQNYGFEFAGWCFDDLGFEETGKHYGNTIEVMTDIMEAIYNREMMIGSIHITSNISGDEIEERYGNRIRSRMRQMFNMIDYDPKSPDRRR